MRPKFRKVAVGGTFDVLHRGHESLLRKTFELGEEVMIGLTTDKFASKIKKRKVNIYRIRRRNLMKFISNEFPNKKFMIFPLSDPFGPTVVDEDIEALVVSEEKKKVAEEINIKREEKGLKPIKIIVLPMIRAKNGMKISSKYILKGLMDREGRLSKKVIGIRS